MTEPELPTPTHRTPAARAEKVIPAALVILGTIWVVGIGSLIVPAWPFAMSDLQWRVHTAALILSAAPQLTLILTLISVAAVFVGQHRAVRAAAVAFFLLAAALTVLVPMFALDFLTQRHLQTQALLSAFTRDGIRIGASAALLIPLMIWAGIRGWSAGKPDPTADGGKGHGLIVGQPG